MRKFLGIVCSLVLILVAGVTFAACGKQDAKVSISASELEIELVIGTEDQSKDVEFLVENFGNGSGQVNFSVEENEKNIVSLESSYLNNGKTKLTVTGLKRGTARIVVTSLQGSAKVVLTVKVVQPITGLELKNEYVNKLYAITGESLNLAQEEIWKFMPSETNQRDLVFSIIGNSQGCEIQDGKLIVANNCALSSVTIRATSAFNSEISAEFEVKILNPIEVVMQIDGKRVVENVENSSSQILNFVEIFPRELDGSVYPNSKEVILVVRAGSESEALNIEKVFFSTEEKFSVQQTAYSYDAASKIHIYKFLIQANSNDAGKIDAVSFKVSYEGFKAGQDDYSVNSVKLNLSSYNKPLSVEVNGESGTTEIDVFENSINFSNGKLIEISLLPGNIKPSENTVTIWAEDFSNLPISLYRLNSTRTGYVCVFGFDQKGNVVGAVQNGIRYATIPSGTKLYAFINSNYNSLVGTNKTARMFAQATDFCNFTVDSTSRALTTMNFVINPNAKSISLAEMNDENILTRVESTTIFVEIGKKVTKYIAIDPNTFTIGSNSVIKIANSKIATIGQLIEFASDENYTYGKFEIEATRVGSSTLTVVLSDGKTKEFNIVVVSPLEKLEMNLEDITFGGNVIESDIVPYKNITDTEVVVGENNAFVALNKLSIANSGGSGIQLIKTPTPSTAQYYLSYKFADFTMPEGETLQTLTLNKVKESLGEENFENVWNDSSDIINTSRLSNLSIIEAKNSGAEGNVLVKVAVYAMNSNGEYGDEPVGYFYYLINFFVPVKGLSLNNGTLELYTYNTIGDKFVDKNGINRSIGSFSVTVNPVNQGLTPTYINNLEIYVNGRTRLTNALFEQNGNVILLSKGGSIVSSLENAALKIVRTKDNNTFIFQIQAFSGEGTYIFALVLSEVNEAKRFTAISRVVVSEAVEISDIDIVNASEKDPIQFNNIIKTNENGEQDEIEAITNPFELELIYNIYGPSGKEITNSSLEFELSWKSLAAGESFVDENGNRVNFASVSNGKITILRAAYDYSEFYNLSEEEREGKNKEEYKKFVVFGGEGSLRIYPTSNYFLSTSGWNGEDPIVEIPIFVSDGTNIAFYITKADDIKLLGQYPNSSFELKTNIEEFPSDYVPVENFSGKLFGAKGSSYYILTTKPLFKRLTSEAVVENFYYANITSELSVKDMIELRSTIDETTYYGGLANINEGTIRNIGGAIAMVADESPLVTALAATTTIGNKGTELLDISFLILPLNKNNAINEKGPFDTSSQLIAGELVKYTGGLVGLNKGVIEGKDGLYYSGSISGANVGGIAGVNDENGSIRNYEFYGCVYGAETAGGIVALNKGNITNCNVLTLSLFNIAVYTLNKKAYDYSKTSIDFAVGGIAAISNGGTIFRSKVEAPSSSDFDPSIFDGIIKSEKIDQEVYRTINGKALGKGNVTATYYLNQNTFEFDNVQYTIDDLTNPTKLTFTLNKENKEIAIVGNRFTIGNASFQISGNKIYASADFATKTIYGGGLVGILGKDASLKECIFNGSISVNNIVSGGFVGKLPANKGNANSRVQDCYAIARYEESSENNSTINGQFIGIGELSEIKNSYVVSNGTFGHAGQGTGTLVSSYLKRQNVDYTPFLNIDEVFNNNSSFGSGSNESGYETINLRYGLTLGSFVNMSWFNLNQKGYLSYETAINGTDVTLTVTVKMGVGEDGTAEFEKNFTFNLKTNTSQDNITSETFTFRGINYNIIIEDFSSYCWLRVRANNGKNIEIEDEQAGTSSNGVQIGKSEAKSEENLAFRSNEIIDKLKDATDTAYFRFIFEETLESEGQVYTITPSVSVLDIFYAKYYYIWVYNNFDALYANKDFISAIGGEDGITFEELMGNIFGISETLTVSELKERIKTIVEGTILPQFVSGFETLKEDVANYKTKFGTLKSAFVQYIRDYYPEKLTDVENEFSLAETLLEQGSAMLNIESATLDNASTIKSCLDLILSSINKTFTAFFENVPENGEHELDFDVLLLFYDIYYAQIMNGSIGNFAYTLKVIEATFKESNMPSTLEDFQNAGWDIANEEEDSNSTWTFKDGELPLLRNKKLTQRISSYELSFKENNKLFRSNVNNKGIMNLLLFNYSVLGELTSEQEARLHDLNTLNISDVFSFGNINGEGEEGTVGQFVISSDNKSVVQIVGGKIQIVGTGEAVLTFSPLYKSFDISADNLKKTVRVYVINPIGDVQIFQGVSTKTDLINNETIFIYKNELSYITISEKTTISLANTVFNFVRNAMAYDIGRDEIFEILGLTAGADEGKFAEGTLTIKPLEGAEVGKDYEFVVKSLLQSQNQNFKNITNLTTFIETVNEILKQYSDNFFANVSIKADRILISIKEAEIDPSSVVSVDSELQTSNEQDELLIVLRDESGKVIWVSKDIKIGDVEYKVINNSNIFEIISDNSGYKNGKIVNKTLISIREDVRNTIVKTSTYTVTFSDSGLEKTSTLVLKLKPQEILNVTYVHNNRTEDSTENGIKIQDEPSSVLMPGDSGLLTIGLYPTYANFSRIVLTSDLVDGQNYILLEQMYKSGQYYLPVSSTTGYLSVRDGNVLTISKPSDPALVASGNIYVRTKMLETVNEGLYFPINITIYALDENGNEYVAKSETITLLSETIDGAQITINGGKDATLARGNTYPIRISVNQSQTLSDYRLSNFESNINNVNDFVALYFNTAEYEVENNRKVYNGTITIGLDAELNSDGVFNVQTTVSKMINGKLESTIDSVEIRVVDFLVEGIKIKGNADGDNVFNTPAAIEKDLNFEFIFSKTPEKTSSEQESSFERIEKGKQEFVNSVSYKQFFENKVDGKEKNYQYVINTDRDFKVNSGYPTHVSTTNCSIAHDLYFTSDMTPYINSITGETQENPFFNIKYNGDKNSTNIDATTLKITGKSVGGVNMTIKIGYRVPGLDYDQYITYNFVVNVQVYSDEDKPTPIENAEQFVEYLTSGGNQYASTNFILMNDIVLENFTPFETTNFASLDGNNKVITIKNFNIPTGNSVNLGLFVAVASNSTVKNLVVNYGQLADIIVPTSVTNFNFGGLAITNSGIIYNCEVVSLDLESGENSPSSDAGIRIYFGSEGKQKADNVSSQIAGLVVSNNSSITNSRVGAKTIFRENGVAVVEGFKHISYVDDEVVTEVFNYGAFNIIGQGNMSGFVITNNGVVGASYFANGKIVNQTTSGSLSETAGFVVANNMEGTIFGSFVEGIKLDSDTSVNITGGGIVAQGISAGFAYENYGSISDCYTNIRLAGESTGRIVSGFVYNNHTSGKVARCYSASTIVGQLTTQMPFSGKNARDEIMQNAEDGLVNCYYLVKKQDTESVLEEKYNTGAIALQISTLRSDTFYGLTLTTKKNGNDGVWAWDGLLPQLVSANQKAISVRRVIKNYSSLVSGGSSIENINIYPYIPGYEYGSQANPIIIRSADEFNRVFGQETGLVKNAYYAISQMYNKDLGIVFGSYRLVASIDFDSLTYVENVKISSSIMDLARNGSTNFGTFDGNALTIANVEVSLDNQSSVGLFSRITGGGVFKNATLTVKSVTTGQNGIYAGAVAGYVSNSSLANITVEPVTATGEGRSKISGQNIVGGVVGAVVGNSTVSNLVSSISVISGNAQAKRDLNNYILNVLRSSATVVNGVLTDKNKDYSFAGGVIGLLDIYEDLNDQSVVSSLPNAKQLTFIGNEVSVQGSIVGGVVGYNGASTYLVDSAFVLKGSEDSLNQRLITYENTIGGVVGVNKGDLFELRIEHDNSIQKKIEDNIQGYYNNESEIFRGNTKLFNSIGTGTNEIYAGGLVGQMLGGNITVSYSRVDVALNKAIAGGVIGFTNTRLDLIEIYAFGDVDGNIAGGIIGRANATVSFERCVAINFISKTNSHLIGAINAANVINSVSQTLTLEDGKLKYQNGEGVTVEFAVADENGENPAALDKVRTININGVTYNVQLSSTGKIVAIEMNGFGTLIGDQVKKLEGSENDRIFNYTISDEVYANGFITYKQLQINFNKGEKEEKSLAPDGLTLDGGLSSYRGYDYDASVINKMFLGADWDASLWELKDGRIFPSFSYGVSTKTIYIEKPKDILKLKKYYKGDNIVIFGDDPTTSFNPYEYDPANKNTWGTFTASELAGLLINKESRKLIFDVSVIQSQVSLGDGGTYFQRFLGVMYGELAAAEENSEWTYELTNITRPLFNVVKGGSISGLSFNLAKRNGDIGEIESAVLANTISGRADLNNLQFTNIKVTKATKIDSNGAAYAAGIIASTMEDVMSISNITITNCEIEINNISDALYIGAIAGKNNTTSISYVKINKVIVKDLTITANDKISGELNVGGMFGETSGKYDFKNSQVTGSAGNNSEINVGLTGTTFAAGQKISVGGFVGNAQGNSTIHRLDNDANLTTVTITIGEAATTYAGLLFGNVGTLITNKDDNPSFQGTIQNATVGEGENSKKTPTTLVIGGAAGSAGNATIFGMFADLKATDLATKTYQVKDEKGQITKTIISSVGSVFGYVGDATIGESDGIRYYKNITITGSDSTETSSDSSAAGSDPSAESNNAIAIGGLIGRAGKLTLSNSGYYGDLTIRYTATTRYIGGLVGRVEGELTLDEVKFNKHSEEVTKADGSKETITTGNIKIERVDGASDGDSSTTYVGGLVGFAKEKATIKDVFVTGDISFPYGYNKEGETSETPIYISANSTVNVGLIAGALNATKNEDSENKIENARVGGDIFFGNETIKGTINAGALVGTFNGGTISSSYAWGNVELKNATLLKDNSTPGNSTPDNEFNIKSLTVGGLVGTVGGATTLSSNYSLTSMYITRLASLKDTKINALVGTILEGKSVTATKDGDTETNFYCHQINLATDTIGQNLYYRSGKVAEHDPILTKLSSGENNFIGSLSDDLKKSGSKFDPIHYISGNYNSTVKGKYYFLGGNPDNLKNLTLNGHLVGDGMTFSSDSTPFKEISETGVVSGIRFVVTSTKEAKNAGRVRGDEFEIEDLPSGVAYENKGIIFAVNVYAKGFAGTNAGFGNVLYSFNAGIAQYNSGLISDSGVVFNVKSLYAGLVSICGTQGTPTNGNEGTPGVIKNSYATGAVHEKAEYALADCRSLTKGVIQNCYSAIDSKNCIYQDFVAENCFYDENAAKNAYNASIPGSTGKSTDELSTVNTEETNILNGAENKLTGNNNWKQDFRVNFGYPYLGNNAYSGFDYLRYNTGGSSGYSSIISLSEIDNPQKYQPKLEYIRSYGLTKWKLYSIYLGDRLGYYEKYIWIDNGYYKFVNLQSTPPSFSETGNVTLSFSIIDYFGRSIILDFKIDTKKVSIEVSDVKNQYIQIPNAGKLAQLQGKSDTNSDAHNESLWGKKYILLSNIDLSATGLTNWSPIGTETNAFKGVFDGKNYKIYNIPEFAIKDARVGFFGYLDGGTIQNCGFIYKDGTTLKSTEDVGGVVGRIVNGYVSNVSSSGATVSNNGNDTNSYGGLVGSIANGTISNSSNYNTVTAKNNAGGIVGYADGTNSITGCNNFGVIKDASRSAGIVAQLVNSNGISNCRNYGNVSGTSAGGIVGEQQSSKISSSQNYGSVTGTTNAGGVVGQAGKTVTQVYSAKGDYGKGKGTVGGWKDTGFWFNFTGINFDDPKMPAFKIGMTNYSFVIKITDKTDKKVQCILGITNTAYNCPNDNMIIKQSDYMWINDGGGTGTWEFSFDLNGIRYFGSLTIMMHGAGNRYVKPISAEIYSFNNSQDTFVNNSFNSGEIKGSKYAGGIVGRLTTNEAINGSRNDGKVSATDSTQCFAGGIVGGTYPGGNHNVGKIESCANTGKITAPETSGWGAKIGSDIATITNCYGGGSVSGQGSGETDGRNGDVTSIPKECASSDKKLWYDANNIVLPEYNEKRNSYLIENNEQFAGMGYQLFFDLINLSIGLGFGDNEEIEIRGYESNKIELVRNLDLSGKLSLFGANNIKDLTIFVKYNEKGYEIDKSFTIQDLNANNLDCLIDSSGRLTISDTSTKKYITSKGKNGGVVFSKVSGETNLEFAYILDETNNTIKIYVNKQVEFCQNGYQIFFESTDLA